MIQDDDIQTNVIELDIHTSINRTISLEAVFIGETYKKKKPGNKLVADCGKLEIERTGVLEQVEFGYITIMCNSSFAKTQ